MRNRRGLLLPIGVALALLVGRILSRGDLVEGAPLRFHPHVGVAREHGARDVSGDAHDHLVTRARLRELRDQRVVVNRAISPSPTIGVIMTVIGVGDCGLRLSANRATGASLDAPVQNVRDRV